MCGKGVLVEGKTCIAEGETCKCYYSDYSQLSDFSGVCVWGGGGGASRRRNMQIVLFRLLQLF